MDNNALARVVDGDTLIFERTVAHPPERVWRAMTDEQEITAWMRYPVKFKAEVGARVSYFDGANAGMVFIADAPHALAFSFWDPNNPAEAGKIETEWTVRWDLEPTDGGTRITFTHRRLSGHVMWGVGDGWHQFIAQLIAFLDGKLSELPQRSWDDAGYTGLIPDYRVHISKALLAFSTAALANARTALTSGAKDEAATALDKLDLATRQLYEIARQKGSRPDFTPEE